MHEKTYTNIHINVSIYHELYHSYFAYCLNMSPLLLHGRVPPPPSNAAWVTFLKYKFDWGFFCLKLCRISHHLQGKEWGGGACGGEALAYKYLLWPAPPSSQLQIRPFPWYTHTKFVAVPWTCHSKVSSFALGICSPDQMFLSLGNSPWLSGRDWPSFCASSYLTQRSVTVILDCVYFPVFMSPLLAVKYLR